MKLLSFHDYHNLQTAPVRHSVETEGSNKCDSNSRPLHVVSSLIVIIVNIQLPPPLQPRWPEILPDPILTCFSLVTHFLVFRLTSHPPSLQNDEFVGPEDLSWGSAVLYRRGGESDDFSNILIARSARTNKKISPLFTTAFELPYLRLAGLPFPEIDADWSIA